MDATTYSALGLDVDAHAKLDENPNGPSWENDTSHDHPYSLPPESAARVQGCPRGEVVEHGLESSTFAGTTRDWWVYVPAQYSADKEANLLVFQDGAAYLGETQEGQAAPDPAVKDGRQVQAAVALDNLHHTGEIPLTIAVFIQPGVNPDDSKQRSFEYDAPCTQSHPTAPHAAKYSVDNCLFIVLGSLLHTFSWNLSTLV